MRKLAIATIIFLVCTAICLCAILVLALSGKGGFHFGDGGQGYYSLAMEKEIPSGDIRSLKIDYGMTYNDVYFYQSEGENIIVREYMNFTPQEKQISRVREEGSRLTIEGVRRNNFLFFSIGSRDAYTEIYLPGDMAEKLEEMYVKTVSGSICSQLFFGIRKDFSVSSTSGDIYFPETRAEKMQISSTSGNVHLPEASAEKITVSTTSGDITLEQAEGNVKISSTSGNVILDNVRGDINVSTTSGDISLGQTEGNMDISSTSGIVRLQEGRGIFDAHTISGDIRVEALDGEFRTNTTSGDFTLMKGNGWGKAGTVSGDVKVFLDSLTGDITASTTSGSVDFRFPETVSVTLDFDSTSGECTTFFDQQLRFSKKGNQAEGSYGGGERKVKVSTVSGDLRITK